MEKKPRAVRKIVTQDTSPLPVGKLPYVDNADTAMSETQTDGSSSPDTPMNAADTESSTHSQGRFAANTVENTGVERGSFGAEIIDDLEDESTPDSMETREDDLTTSETGAHKKKKKRNRKSGSALRTPRDVNPRKDYVEFTDEENAKQFSQRHKRTRLAKGGMFFNARDREIILQVAAHGWLDKRQMCALIGNVSVASIGHSLKRLVDHGLLENKYAGFIGQSLYTSTAFGLRKVGADGFRTGVTPRTQTIEHTDAITAISTYFTQLKNPNVIFVTEREMYAAVSSGKLSPRVLTTAPWTEAYENFQDWVPRTVTDSGRESYKRPDGYLLTFTDGKAQLPIPVEAERTIKSRPDYYQQAALMFANAAKNGHIASTVMYFVPESGGVAEELRKALRAVYAGGSNWPALLPKIKFEVNDLDPLYHPYSVRRGWLPAGKHSDD